MKAETARQLFVNFSVTKLNHIRLIRSQAVPFIQTIGKILIGIPQGCEHV
jgi:hypothetical protein